MQFEILDENIQLEKISIKDKLFDMPTTGMSICYDIDTKRLTNRLGGDHIIPIGTVINVDCINNEYYINVLYKGFLLKDVLDISQNIKTHNIQNFIKGQFKRYKNNICMKMPKIKRLKRLNLKILTFE